MIDCEHKKTEIWEPHLAGARKCLDCKMVYNPNRSPSWFCEHEPRELGQFEQTFRCKMCDSKIRRIIIGSVWEEVKTCQP